MGLKRPSIRDERGDPSQHQIDGHIVVLVPHDIKYRREDHDERQVESSKRRELRLTPVIAPFYPSPPTNLTALTSSFPVTPVQVADSRVLNVIGMLCQLSKDARLG